MKRKAKVCVWARRISASLSVYYEAGCGWAFPEMDRLIGVCPHCGKPIKVEENP